MTIILGLLWLAGILVIRWGVKVSNDEAGRGALISIAGFVLLLPWLGKFMWDAEQKKKHAHRMPQLEQSAVFESIIRAEDASYRAERALAKQEVLTKLNGKLAIWYKSLQDRRQKLETQGEAEVMSFNKEAAAYQSLLAVTREEAAEIKKLQTH